MASCNRVFCTVSGFRPSNCRNSLRPVGSPNVSPGIADSNLLCKERKVFCRGCSSGKAYSEELRDCVACAPGMYQNSVQNDSVAIISCKKCEPGRYQNKEGQTTCPQCEPGKYASREQSHECTDCPSGYKSQELQQCSKCKVGRYQKSRGQTNCPQW